DKLVTGVQTCALPILPVWNWCASPSFSQRFGEVQHFVPDPGLNPLRDGVVPFARLTAAATAAVDSVADDLDLVDLNGERHPFLRSEERRVGKGCRRGG